MNRALTATKSGKFSLLQLALPAKAVQNIGVLLLDPATDHLHLKLRSDWNAIAEPEHAEVLSALESDLDGKRRELGGGALLGSLEDSLSHMLRITERENIIVSDFPTALERLFEEHVQRTEVIP